MVFIEFNFDFGEQPETLHCISSKKYIVYLKESTFDYDLGGSCMYNSWQDPKIFTVFLHGTSERQHYHTEDAGLVPCD
jgi:hypothetical protein